MQLLHLILLVFFIFPLSAEVTLGIDNLLNGKHEYLLKGKHIGLITNHTAVNRQMKTTIALLKEGQKTHKFTLAALFAPEHGLNGSSHANEWIKDGKDKDGTPVYSLHGATKRPTKAMLSGLDTLIFDIQDIGSRSYTYISTLFYVMEEAAKNNVEVIVLDRPNPINGLTIDGPMLEPKWRSFVGYIDVPYCHGMTVGELARCFNEENQVGCKLTVVPMIGWKRSMTYRDTQLPWIPTSPHIPEATTAWFYPTTGILGEISLVSIGVGYPLPFKVIGAPWIEAEAFTAFLNKQDFPGVIFHPFHFTPFYGTYSKEECHGAMLVITDHKKFLPVTTQYLLIGVLKSLYPKEFSAAMKKSSKRKEMFCKVNGTEEVWRLMEEEPYIAWKLKTIDEEKRAAFKIKREKYLIDTYR